MNRREVHEAIHALCQTQHMASYALEAALQDLDLEHLKQVFDNVADHYDMVVIRRPAPRPARDPLTGRLHP